MSDFTKNKDPERKKAYHGIPGQAQKEKRLGRQGISWVLGALLAVGKALAETGGTIFAFQRIECESQSVENGKMAVIAGNLVLCLPGCQMALKAWGCPECQYHSCMALAERTVRLAMHCAITTERHSEMKADLEQLCPLASA